MSFGRVFVSGRVAQSLPLRLWIERLFPNLFVPSILIKLHYHVSNIFDVLNLSTNEK